jgi:hypothetical protein
MLTFTQRAVASAGGGAMGPTNLERFLHHCEGSHAFATDLQERVKANALQWLQSVGAPGTTVAILSTHIPGAAHWTIEGRKFVGVQGTRLNVYMYCIVDKARNPAWIDVTAGIEVIGRHLLYEVWLTGESS